MAKAKTPEVLVINPPNFQTVEFHCSGTSPLVMNKFSAKAQAKIKATQEAGQKAKSKKKHEPRDFDADYEGAKHTTPEGWVGIPAPAFRSAMISACRAAGYVMTKAKLAVFIEPDGFDIDDGTPLVRIIEGEPEKHMGYVRNETGVVDLRCRPMWREWKFIVRIRFDADMLGAIDVANLLMRAGMQVGVLEGRPDSKKSHGQGWGTFTIEEGV